MRTIFIALLVGLAVQAQGTKAVKVNKPAPVTTATPKGSYEMERGEGNSMKTELGYGFAVNKASTLKREWFVVRDQTSPVALVGRTGVDVTYLNP